MVYCKVLDSFNLKICEVTFLCKMNLLSLQRRKSNKTPKPVNFVGYNNVVFENYSMFSEEIDEKKVSL